MLETIIFIIIAFGAGFGAAWIIRTIAMAKAGKLQKSTEGYLESERLMKETLQKENAQLHQQKQLLELDFEKKMQQAHQHLKLMDENILLLQKSNEDTEALMKEGQPAMHSLKLQLLEAQNTIARYKYQLELKK